MNSHITPIAVLVQSLRHAKAAEAAANHARLAIEEQIVSRFPVPVGGEGTVKDEEFSIAFKVTRKVDADALFSAYGGLPENAQKAFKFKADVSLNQYRSIQKFDPKTFTTVAAFVTTTPSKPFLILKD